MYSSTLKRVDERLKEVEFVAITTDLWTSVANTDFMSITVYYLNNEFVYQHLCLEVTPFPEVSHTGENICRSIVRDSGRNIAAGLKMSPFQHTSCLAHTLQLVVKDAVLTNKIVVNINFTCHKLVGHFKHSAHATKVLKSSQNTAGVSQHMLIQEEPTRWNTTLHMLKRLHEQKRALLLANAELKLTELSNTQWTLIQNIFPIDVFDSVTNHISSNKINASEVIPIVHVVVQSLSKPAPMGSGLQGLVNDLSSSIKIRFADMEIDSVLTTVTLTDPRFKVAPFKDGTRADLAKEKFLHEAVKISCKGRQNNSVR
ncbi:hypothetical protein PR048_012926 [Dryococelus australis]|uniref:Uncharacterized protein n=1 Tax=Dryococelus australis TaxID=614101 RepID=A0ABQ9HQS0_9NEOP|nr:hypothetical protein PR048_012926 [Dryococelus australis]